MKMQKRQFRIGELAKTLGVERFVIRFWEKEFRFSAHRSEGGQRFYSERDLLRFQIIKTLLYEQGFTIAGAKKQLSTASNHKEQFIIASHKTSLEADKSSETVTHYAAPQETDPSLAAKLLDLRTKLYSLKNSLS